MKSRFNISHRIARHPQHNPQQTSFDWNVIPTPSAERVPPCNDRPAPAIQSKPVPVIPKRSLRDTVERFLRERGVPYINVDEAKRALFAGAKLRSFHFVVYRTTGKNWLVFATALRRESREDLRQWEGIFGDGFVAVVAKQASNGALRFATLAGEPMEIV